MSTNASIAIKHEDGSYEQIYVHWDGDTSYTGRILRTYYKTREMVERLINLGNLSSIGPEIGTKHDFDMRDHDMCTAYRRDRDDSENEARKFVSFAELAFTGRIEEYNYLFIDGEWYWCTNSITREKLVHLGANLEANV